MLNKFFLLILYVCYVSLCHAQGDSKLYFDSLDNKVLNSADAYYYQVIDSSRGEIKMKYYYLNGKLYAEGKGVWAHSPNIYFLQRSGKWIYYYPNGNKKEILENLPYLPNPLRSWYEDGTKAYQRKIIYSFRMKGWYQKHRYWYSNGKPASISLARGYYNNKCGYYKCYTSDGRCWLKEYFAESNLQGLSVYTDSLNRIRYFIALNGLSFDDVSFDPKMLEDTTTEPSFLEAKEGYNDLIYDLDTFRFTVKNGKIEGPYYHSNGRRGIIRTGFYHRNYKTGMWLVHTPSKKGSYIDYCYRYKKGFEHGTGRVYLNDSVLLAKQHYRYGRKTGMSLSMNGLFSDPRYTYNDDDLLFIEEKYRNDEKVKHYSKVYAADRSTYHIKYLKWQNKRIWFLSDKTVYIEYYPNHQVKKRIIHNDKKKQGIEKTYDESGKLLEKKRVS